MSRTKSVRKQRRKAPSNINSRVDSVVTAGGRVGDGIRSQVAELDLPGKVAELDIPGKVAELHLPERVAELDIAGRVAHLDLPSKVADARRELAARIEPAPARHTRRRVLWIGLFLTAAAALAWAVLSRRPSELEPGPPQATPPAPPSPAPGSVTSTPNGSAPSANTSSGTKN